MKANELMIGDWAGFNSGYGKVTGITDAGVHFEDRFGLGIASGAEPIPLTPEILGKNGFEKSEHGWYCNRKIDAWEIEIYIGRIETSVKINKGIFPYINNIDCHFVHQLQHALRLCGIDKEITL